MVESFINKYLLTVRQIDFLNFNRINKREKKKNHKY